MIISFRCKSTPRNFPGRRAGLSARSPIRMAIALLDTNILIDALNQIPQALTEIGYYQRISISSMTWMELMVKPLAEQSMGRISALDMQRMRRFLCAFMVLHMDDAIMIEAAKIRASSLVKPPKMALPDAIIQATAQVKGYLLVTRNKKDFRCKNLRLPYELQNGAVFNVAAPPDP